MKLGGREIGGIATESGALFEEICGAQFGESCGGIAEENDGEIAADDSCEKGCKINGEKDPELEGGGKMEGWRRLHWAGEGVGRGKEVSRVERWGDGLWLRVNASKCGEWWLG